MDRCHASRGDPLPEAQSSRKLATRLGSLEAPLERYPFNLNRTGLVHESSLRTRRWRSESRNRFHFSEPKDLRTGRALIDRLKSIGHLFVQRSHTRTKLPTTP